MGLVVLIVIVVLAVVYVLPAIFDARKTIGVGCLGAVVLFVLIGAAILGWDKFTSWRAARQAEESSRMEAQKAKEAEETRIAEAKRRQKAKDEKIQAFALKEAPKVWEVYQSLRSEIDVQDEKIEELRKSLETFGRTPEEDTDFVRICALRDEMKRSRDALRTKLEDAYIAARKYEAAPSRKDYQELHKKALEDGILEADAASARFKEMRLNK
ncbi:MAG: hypothetical protein J5727_08810 [Kiritimatiellae bacterium]|nr:hypothetical protein [Kiritimatiellia bacterium]